MKKTLLFALSVLLLFSLVSCDTKSTCSECGNNCEATDKYCSNCGAILSYDENEKGSEGLQYHLKSDGTYSVSWGTTNHLDKIVIPKMYNGKLVTKIEGRHEISAWNAKEVIIPDSITTIGQYAFASFVNLTEFVVSDHITNIESGAFYNCDNLKSIKISAAIKTIEQSTFAGCDRLEEIVLPNSIEEIKRQAFEYCCQLTSITIPKSVITVDETAFDYCTRLVEVINYSDLVFENYHIKKVHQGESLIKTVDNFKFLTMDDATYLISYVGNEEKIVLPQHYNGSEYELIPNALSNLKNMKEIEISDTIDTLPIWTFYKSINLNKIILPKSITTIESWFADETNITDIYYLGTKSEWKTITKRNNWNDGFKAKIHCTDGDIE